MAAGGNDSDGRKGPLQCGWVEGREGGGDGVRSSDDGGESSLSSRSGRVVVLTMTTTLILWINPFYIFEGGADMSEIFRLANDIVCSNANMLELAVIHKKKCQS